MSIIPFQAKPWGAPRKALRASVLALLCLVAPFASQAEPPLPPAIISQGARVLPVLASHGMVVAQEGTAAKIGVDILLRGGNAVDAAVAVGFALAVTLPRAGNLGGGGFMLVYLAKEKKTVAIDYREAAPADTPRDVFSTRRARRSPRNRAIPALPSACLEPSPACRSPCANTVRANSRWPSCRARRRARPLRHRRRGRSRRIPFRTRRPG